MITNSMAHFLDTASRQFVHKTCWTYSKRNIFSVPFSYEMEYFEKVATKTTTKWKSFRYHQVHESCMMQLDSRVMWRSLLPPLAKSECINVARTFEYVILRQPVVEVASFWLVYDKHTCIIETLCRKPIYMCASHFSLAFIPDFTIIKPVNYAVVNVRIF